MLSTPVVEASAPQIWGAEGMTSCAKDVQSPLLSCLNAYTNDELTRICNPLTTSEDLSQPEQEIKFDESLDELFAWNNLGNENAGDFASILNENSSSTTMMSNEVFDSPEEIWGFDTFNEDNLGMCAPASVVEGAEEIDFLMNDTDEPMKAAEETAPETSIDVENDLLKWIVDDQNIEDIPELSNTELESFQIPVSTQGTTASFYITELPENIKVEVKTTTDLNEEEKYRKMRIQNNEASRKCRQNRKRKLQEMDEECQMLQDRNTFLKAKVAEMEEEVKSWKRKLLSDIKSSKPF